MLANVWDRSTNLTNRVLHAGVLVSAMRVFTKALYPHDARGLRRSATLYFSVSIAAMVLCAACYNVADRLPVVAHYRDIKRRAAQKAAAVLLPGGPPCGASWAR
jgi:solute carrier family 29 (equilibrative nucleoside transporter), member 1/2/3